MKASYKIYLLLLLSMWFTASHCQQITYNLLNHTIREFEKAEWDIHLSTPFTNPYNQQEIRLDMILMSPSGKPVDLPCYFEKEEGNSSLWKARFAPQESGTYTYYFSLKHNDTVTESTKNSIDVLASNRPGFLHKHDLWTFRFDNGDLFRGIGENIAWESRSFEDPKWTYEYLLPTLSKNGANFFRTWMCPWNLPLEWQKVNNTKRYVNASEYFNPGGIKRMDELVRLADSLHLYMMLTLDMNSGNWPNNPYNLVNGGPIRTWKDFFTSEAAMDRYKNKLRYLVARWGYSTSIAAWEFFNEIDNGAFTKGDSIIIPHINITNWHAEMARYLKDTDPYGHLVTTSISHRDIAGLNSIADIDFNQKHIYKHTEKIPGIYPDYIQTYGKPYVIGEFGYRWEDQDPQYAKEADFDYKRGLWFGLFSPTPILPMSWWWELFDKEKMAAEFNVVKVISDMMLNAGKGTFQPLTITADRLHVQGLQCGSKTFVYVLNNTSETKDSDISVPYQTRAKVALQIFYPSTGKFKTVTGFKISGNQLIIPKIRLGGYQELVLIATSKN